MGNLKSQVLKINNGQRNHSSAALYIHRRWAMYNERRYYYMPVRSLGKRMMPAMGYSHIADGRSQG